MKSKLFDELKELGNTRVTIWERLQGDSNITTVTSGSADKVLKELTDYYADYSDDAVEYDIDLPVITVVLK